MTKAKSKPKTERKTAKSAPVDQSSAATPVSGLAASFSIGDRVHHPMFGDGAIEAIGGDNLTIKFKGNITKEIRADFVSRKK